MSVQQALRFIEAVGNDDALADRLRALGPDPDPDRVVTLGRRAGYEFTPEELRAAFARDWAMRRAFYSGRED